MSEIEGAWLEYAWGVVQCPRAHMDRCISAGASVPGTDRREGNDLRWPGYLGRSYKGILCVSHAHRERDLAFEKANPEIGEVDAELVGGVRSWKESARSEAQDRQFLNKYRQSYKAALSLWPVWTKHFRPLVEHWSKLSLDDIAFTNLAKCRVPFPPGSPPGYNLIDVCQEQFPIYDLVQAIRPRVVLLSVLPAAEGGRNEVSFSGPEVSPLIISWHGRTGHDRNNTAEGARSFKEWAPEAAAVIRQEAENYAAGD